MLSNTNSVTIIGFGAFGKLIASLLAPHLNVSVYDCSKSASRLAAKLGFPIISHPRNISTKIVILAVPLQGLNSCLLEIAPHLRAGQLIIDVCSIKEEPARLMGLHLPPQVEILASHPMFGPQSAIKKGGSNQIVLCPIRGRKWRRVAAFLRQCLQLQIIVTTPEDHDRQAAMTQGLTHLLARAYATFGEFPKIRTRSFDLLVEAFAMIENDAPEVFEAITQDNCHVFPVYKQLILALSELSPPVPEYTIQHISNLSARGRSYA